MHTFDIRVWLFAAITVIYPAILASRDKWNIQNEIANTFANTLRRLLISLSEVFVANEINRIKWNALTVNADADCFKYYF